MRKTAVVVSLALAALAIAGCSTLNAVGAMLGSQVTFTQPQLQRALDRSFPKDYDKLGGLASLRLGNPTLSIPYDSHRLRLGFNVDAMALGSEVPVASGRISISSGLRFDTQTLGLHLQDPVIESIDMPSLGGALKEGPRELVNTWLAQYARDEPVYRLDDSLVQRLVSRRIGSTEIEHGVVVMNVSQ
ncbi:MAG TPA: hypothetical protein VFS82_06400 [Lysobacter sp.]|nr:hypothetical protein [Lysobacter sp.]